MMTMVNKVSVMEDITDGFFQRMGIGAKEKEKEEERGRRCIRIQCCDFINCSASNVLVESEDHPLFESTESDSFSF
jgi:hypothetical protein